MKFRGTVVVALKEGIFDPQGEAVRGSLQALGYKGLSRVRMGKHIVLHLEAESRTAAEETLNEMARRLLANPVTETFSVSVEPE